MARIKTGLMVLGLATVLGAGTACFGLFTRDEVGSSAPATTVEECKGLSGQALVDCEKAHGR